MIKIIAILVCFCMVEGLCCAACISFFFILYFGVCVTVIKAAYMGSFCNKCRLAALFQMGLLLTDALETVFKVILYIVCCSPLCFYYIQPEQNAALL